jgi:hypothetical protein
VSKERSFAVRALSPTLAMNCEGDRDIYIYIYRDREREEVRERKEERNITVLCNSSRQE